MTDKEARDGQQDKVEPQHDDRTIAERRFDELVVERRAKGRKTYGKGLDHNDEFCWKMMALEEALDMGQYLMAHIVRLEAEIAGRA